MSDDRKAFWDFAGRLNRGEKLETDDNTETEPEASVVEPEEQLPHYRPVLDSAVWQITKLPRLTAGDRLFLLACWRCEELDGEIWASNNTLSDWAACDEKTVRNHKRRLEARGYVVFSHHSKGKADREGYQTDRFTVDWVKVAADANISFRERQEKTASRNARKDQAWRDRQRRTEERFRLGRAAKTRRMSCRKGGKDARQ